MNTAAYRLHQSKIARTRRSRAVVFEACEQRLLFATYSVTNAADSGPGSLRQAITNANNNAGADTITFAIPGSGPYVISPATGLPSITDALTIDGTTQSGYAGKPIIQLSGASAGSSDGLYVNASNCTIKGLVIRQFALSGIVLFGASSNTIQNCYIGTDLSGNNAAGNTYEGVYIGGGASSNKIINDVISGNGTTGSGGTFAPGLGIFDAGSNANAITGCFIGTNAAGTAAIPNAGAGVSIYNGPQFNQIGTNGDGVNDAAERNIISGNNYEGVAIGAANNNIIAGSYIGTDVSGSLSLPNHTNGVLLYASATGNRVGVLGSDTGAANEGNVISANAWSGVGIYDPGTNANVVAGNAIGTNAAKTGALGNGNHGVAIGNGAQSNRIGTNGDGSGDALERNIISANSWSGVGIFGTYDFNNPGAYNPSLSTNNNVVAGNYIGTTSTGTAALGNGNNGIFIGAGARGNRIGVLSSDAVAAADSNVISANSWSGVSLSDPNTYGNTVAGNAIGTDANRTLALGNHNHGLFIGGGAQSNRIGTNSDGSGDALERNVISANSWSGVFVQGTYDSNNPSAYNPATSTNSNVIAGNYIGTDGSGTAAMGNANYGIEISAGARNNGIGLSTASSGNIVAFNTWTGIRIDGDNTLNNTVRFNSAWGNPYPQFDLGFDATTMNDNGDADTGANNLQNYPVITTATAGSSTSIAGYLNSTPGSNFTLDFYLTSTPDAGLFGPGAPSNWLGSSSATTNGSGLANFSQSFAVASSAGQWVYATATDAAGNTSEYSASRQLNSAPISLSTATWTNIGPGPINSHDFNGAYVTGRVNVALPDPANANTMFIATDGGGIWKTTNWNSAQVAWTPLTDNQPSLEFDVGYNTLVRAPSNAQVMYAAVSGPGGGILKSTNDGASWTLLGNSTFNNASLSTIAVNPTNANILYVAARTTTSGNGGVFESTDGGVSWNNTTASIGTNSASDVLIDPTNAQVLYAGLVRLDFAATSSPTAGVYKSINGGTSWSLLGGGLLTGTAIGSSIRLAMARSLHTTLYASVFDPSLGNSPDGFPHRYVTTNSGTNWTSLSVPLDPDTSQPDQEGRYWHVVLSVDPTHPQTLYVNGDHSLYQSIDGGSSWTKVYDEDPVNVSFDNAAALIMTGDRGIYRWTGGSAAFANKQGNLADAEIYTIAVDPTDPNIVYGVSQDQFAVAKNFGVGVWNMAGGGEETGRVLVDPTNPSRLYLYTPLGGGDGGTPTTTLIHRSDDGGASFTDLGSEIPENLANFDFAYSSQHGGFVMDPSNSSRLLLGTDRVWQSTNAAANWSAISPVLSSGSFITAVGIAPSSANTVYAATRDGKIFVTTDGGATWPQRNGGLSLGFYNHVIQFAVDPANPSHAYIIIGTNRTGFSDNNKVFVTTNGGTSWINVSGNVPPDDFAQALAVDWRSATPVLYLGTARGIFRSTNGGTGWTSFGAGMPNVLMQDLQLVPQQNLLAAATYGRGVFEIAVMPPPSVVSANYLYNTSPNTLSFGFNEDVTTSLGAISVQNLTTSQPLSVTGFNYNSSTHTANFTFNSPIPDGNYRATLSATGVTDASGDPMQSDYNFSFFFLNGDANHDRVVDVTDLGILATNWQNSVSSFSQADFNYDHHVDVTDLGILATNWQKSLPASMLPLAQAARPAAAAPTNVQAAALPAAPPPAGPFSRDVIHHDSGVDELLALAAGFR